MKNTVEKVHKIKAKTEKVKKVLNITRKRGRS